MALVWIKRKEWCTRVINKNMLPEWIILWLQTHWLNMTLTRYRQGTRSRQNQIGSNLLDNLSRYSPYFHKKIYAGWIIIVSNGIIVFLRSRRRYSWSYRWSRWWIADGIADGFVDKAVDGAVDGAADGGSVGFKVGAIVPAADGGSVGVVLGTKDESFIKK